MKKMIGHKFLLTGLLLTLIIIACSCQKQQSAIYNNKMNSTAVTEMPIKNDTVKGTITTPVPGSKEEQQSSDSNKDTNKATKEDTNKDSDKIINKDAIIKETAIYDCDIVKDKEQFDPKSVDIVVGDKYYATQINDWYENFKDYDGETVEIEGYYIDYSPYTFVGRFGPSCPYCQGGYVCFEFVTDEDLNNFESDKDWIKVKGILRQGSDSEAGDFYYIEALSIEKMDKVGVDTVKN